MFADMKSMVTKARREQYALLAINCMNTESARAAVRAAEKHRAPIILNLYQGHLGHFPAPIAVAVVKTLAEEASVPVALALDHGKDPVRIRRFSRRIQRVNDRRLRLCAGGEHSPDPGGG